MKAKEIKSTNHHSMSHLTMIHIHSHRWRWTVVQHCRHCRHFHLSAAMRMTVTHFLFDATEPSIKVIESVDELKLWNLKLSANKHERRNSFQPEGMSVPVLSGQSQVTLSARSRWILAKFFFACLWTETKSRCITRKNGRGQYPAILAEQAWSIEDLLYGIKHQNMTNFPCGTEPVPRAGKIAPSSILPAREARDSVHLARSLSYNIDPPPKAIDGGAKEQKRTILASLKWGKGWSRCNLVPRVSRSRGR